MSVAVSYLLPPQQFWNPYQVWATDYSQHRIHLNCYINGKGPVQLLFDTGSDITMVNPVTARQLGLTALKPIRYLDVQGVGGSQRLPIVTASLKIEKAAPFNSEIVLGQSEFNLLSRKELTRVFNINITATGVSLVPKAGVGGGVLNRRSSAVPVETQGVEFQPGPAGLGGIPPVVLVAGGLILFAMVLR